MKNTLRSLRQATGWQRVELKRRVLMSKRPFGIITFALTAGFTVYLANTQSEYVRHRLKTSLFIYNDSTGHPDPITSASKSAFRQDPETSIPFPLVLPLTTSCPSLTLAGLGVRKVSFLRVKVYSVGFYLEKNCIKSLDAVPGWHSFTAQHLLTAPSSQTVDPLGAPQLSGEALMRNLLDTPIACAVRIVPSRNTDFAHLRDAFTRNLTARQKVARVAGELTTEDETRINASIQVLKSLLPVQSIPKGNSLVLLRTSQGNLTVEYEGSVLGEVRDVWVARELMLAYFADKDVISPALKEDVARGLEERIKL